MIALQIILSLPSGQQNAVYTARIYLHNSCPSSYSFNTLNSGGSDYECECFNVTFPAGVNVISFNVAIIDDIIAECAKFFTLDLEIPPPSAPMDVLKVSPDTATVSIRDDDGEHIHCMICLSVQCDSELL